MIVSRIDPQSKSSLAAMKGSKALADGDTLLARQKYSEAGEILLHGSKIDLPATHKHMLRFLAASQFYHGGDYSQAAKIAKTINRGHLPPSDYQCFDQFLKDIAIRTTEGYANKIWDAVRSACENEQFEQGLSLLKQHPYIGDRFEVAAARAGLCLGAGKLKAAVLFSADANRFSDFLPKIVLARAEMGLDLFFENRHEEAVAIQDMILSHDPTAMDFAFNGTHSYFRQLSGVAQTRSVIMDSVDTAVSDFMRLPETTQKDARVRDGMALALLAASAAADGSSDRTRAMNYFQKGREFATSNAFVQAYQKLHDEHLTNIPSVLDTLVQSQSESGKTTYAKYLTAA